MSDHLRMKHIPQNTLPGFRRFTQRLCIALLSASLVACVIQLPPAPTPPAVAPPIEPAPPPPSGQGRLVVDVVDGPTPVQRIRMGAKQIDNGRGRQSYRLLEVPEVFCAASPCAVDVPAGNILLGFPVIGDSNTTEVELVHVGPDPSVYRRALSIYDRRSGGMRVLGIVMTAVGGTAVMTGTALLPIGISKANDGLTIAGGATLGVGAALLVLGILAIRRDSPTYQPGSSNHFPLPATNP